MDLGRQLPRMFAALSDLMMNYCAMEDAWLAKQWRQGPNSGLPEVPKEGNRVRRHRKSKHSGIDEHGGQLPHKKSRMDDSDGKSQVDIILD